MLTTSDINKLKTIFLTRDEFSRFDTAYEERFTSLELKFDRAYSKLDLILGELQAMREEMAVFAYRSSDHEDRIVKLEAYQAS